jgi:hypothetical protein
MLGRVPAARAVPAAPPTPRPWARRKAVTAGRLPSRLVVLVTPPVSRNPRNDRNLGTIAWRPSALQQPGRLLEGGPVARILGAGRAEGHGRR